VTPDYPEIVNIRMARGGFFTEAELTAGATVCVLGEDAARDLFGSDDPLGKKVTIGRTAYDVVGVMARKPVSEEDLNQHIYIPLVAALRRVKRDPDASEIDRIILAIKDAQFVKPTAALVAEWVRTNHQGVNDFEVSVPEEKLELQQQARSLMNYVLAVMAAIALLVGGIGIMNIMLATVTERTREIGIRRSVGATEKDILKQFLAEAVGISFVGGFIGIGLGFLLGWQITFWANWAGAVFSIYAMFLGFGVAVSIGLIFGIYPAWIAAKQDPITALRYE
jgi:putative ABC transport system permease protein